jgi:hypothetical protein
MYDFLAHNSLYVVLSIALIVFAGIGYMLFRLEKNVSDIERKLDATSSSSSSSQ